MFTNRRGLVGGLLAVTIGTLGALVPVSAPAQAADVDCHARMNSTSRYPNAYGGARYESHNGGREFEINLHGIAKLSGKTVRVRVHGDLIGRMTVSRSGYAHLYRRSGAPTMQAGNTVRVINPSGNLVSYGTLRNMHHNGMM